MNRAKRRHKHSNSEQISSGFFKKLQCPSVPEEAKDKTGKSGAKKDEKVPEQSNDEMDS